MFMVSFLIIAGISEAVCGIFKATNKTYHKIKFKHKMRERRKNHYMTVEYI